MSLDLTSWPDLGWFGEKISGNERKGCLIRYAKTAVRHCAAFFSFLQKPEGILNTPLPSERGLNYFNYHVVNWWHGADWLDDFGKMRNLLENDNWAHNHQWFIHINCLSITGGCMTFFSAVLLGDGTTMDHAEFRKRGRQMVDYIADYMESLHLRRVTPDIEPGKVQIDHNHRIGCG